MRERRRGHVLFGHGSVGVTVWCVGPPFLAGITRSGRLGRSRDGTWAGWVLPIGLSQWRLDDLFSTLGAALVCLGFEWTYGQCLTTSSRLGADAST